MTKPFTYLMCPNSIDSSLGCGTTKKRNPLMEGADPFILVHKGKYYLYFTKEDDGFKVYESSDLITWVDKGYCLKRGEGIIGNGGFWAPEIIY